MTRLSCAAVITTYNRREDLRRTCLELRKLDPQPDELIICLDGCSDGTKEMLQSEFPEWRIIENDAPQGSIPSRDRAFREVVSELILTLDDDSYPTDPGFIAKASDIVRAHPECGAFTFPEIRNDGRAADPQLAPDSTGKYIRDFPNCAGIMLRSLYGTVVEYPTFFSHAYAEPDYCLQLYAAGYAVWFEPSLPVRHHFTPVRRSMLARHKLNARNELWSTLMRCPWVLLWFMAPWRVLRQLAFAVSQGSSWLVREPQWWAEALRGVPRAWSRRQPIDARSYWNWVRLARRPIRTLAKLQERFGRGFARLAPLGGARETTFSIMITTRNRAADLARTLDVVSALDPPPRQVLVTADGCTDETVQLVGSRFPQFELIENVAPRGSVASRHEMIQRASAEIVISLDDDSHPVEANFLAKLPIVFRAHPDAAVVTFSELRDGNLFSTGLSTPHRIGLYVSAYPNCAAAMRRDAYLARSGFPAFFHHMYEETDYALQCYAYGHAVWFEPSIIIRHHVSPVNREEMKRHHLNARNELWSVWMRCPWPWLPIVSAYRIWRQFRYAWTVSPRWALWEVRWWVKALGGAAECRRRRAPIPWRAYYQWMRLARHPRYAPIAYQPAARKVEPSSLFTT